MSPRSHCHSSTLEMEAEASTETSVEETLAVRWLTLLKKIPRKICWNNCISLTLTTASVNYKLSLCHFSATSMHLRTHTHTHTDRHTHTHTHTHRGHFHFFEVKVMKTQSKQFSPVARPLPMSFFSWKRNELSICLQSNYVTPTPLSTLCNTSIASIFYVRSQNCQKRLLPHHVCGSVRMEQFSSQWTDFHEIWNFRILPKPDTNIEVSLKSDENKEYFHENVRIFIITSR